MVGTLTEETTGQIRVASPATVVELVGPADGGFESKVKKSSR